MGVEYNKNKINMKTKEIYYWIIGAVIVLGLGIFAASIHGVEPGPDEEAVLIKRPWIFGHGGVDDIPVQTGLTWCVFSTTSEVFKIVPVRHEIILDDLFSDDNTPLDFKTVIITQIEKGKSPVLLRNYGTDWFNTNLYNYFCNIVREHVSQHSPFDLMSNREVLAEIDKKVLSQMQRYVLELSKKKEMPVVIKDVIIGKASPNKEQLEEMNRTAKVVQAKQTQEREYEVQVAREKAQKQRAKADKAYMNEMNLSPSQFINLKWIETVANKEGANIDVLVGSGSEPIWNIKR